MLRRRPHLLRQRAALLAHVQQTNRQSHLPEIGQKLADQANREGVAERVDDPAIHKTMAIDLALITDDDQRLSDLARFILNTAKHHDAQPLYLLQTVPGIGKILRLVLRYDIHQIERFPRGQDFASSCRLSKGAKESGGQRLGTSGNKIGNAHLKWACSEAATLFRRGNEPGQKYLARLENTHDQGKALSILAHTLARAVSVMRKRHTACDLAQFLCTSGAERVSPAPNSTRTRCVCSRRTSADHGGVVARGGPSRPPLPEPRALLGHALWLSSSGVRPQLAHVCCPSPEPAPNWRASETQPGL